MPCADDQSPLLYCNDDQLSVLSSCNLFEYPEPLRRNPGAQDSFFELLQQDSSCVAECCGSMSTQESGRNTVAARRLKVEDCGTKKCQFSLTNNIQNDKACRPKVTQLRKLRHRRARYPSVRSDLALKIFDEARKVVERNFIENIEETKYSSQRSMNAILSRRTRREYSSRLRDAINKKRAELENIRERLQQEKQEVENLKVVFFGC